MGRPSKFDTDRVLDAALCVLERDGMRALTMTRVAEELGAPSGSVYHRFASRTALLVALWLRSAERFQRSYREVVEAHHDAHEAARAAARYIIERARRHRAEALVLMAYRREDLLGGAWPTAVRKRAQALEADHRQMAQDLARRLWPDGGEDVPRMNFAVATLPVAAAMAELRGVAGPERDTMTWVETALTALLADCPGGD